MLFRGAGGQLEGLEGDFGGEAEFGAEEALFGAANGEGGSQLGLWGFVGVRVGVCGWGGCGEARERTEGKGGWWV